MVDFGKSKILQSGVRGWPGVVACASRCRMTSAADWDLGLDLGSRDYGAAI